LIPVVCNDYAVGDFWYYMLTIFAEIPSSMVKSISLQVLSEPFAQAGVKR